MIKGERLNPTSIFYKIGCYW